MNERQNYWKEKKTKREKKRTNENKVWISDGKKKKQKYIINEGKN